MRRWAFDLLGLAALLLSMFGCASLSEGDRVRWQHDYEAVREHLCRSYANLEWIVGHRGLDAHGLHRDTTRALEEASSPAEAAAALRGFVAAFEDPHLRLEEPWSSGLQLWWQGMPFHSLDGREVCADMGFGRDRMDFELDFEEVGAFERLPDPDGQPFPAGVLRLENGRSVGVLRIGSFGFDAYLECGLAAWEHYSREHPEDTDPTEGWGFFVAACNEIVSRLTDRVRELSAREVAGLVIDITGNGG